MDDKLSKAVKDGCFFSRWRITWTCRTMRSNSGVLFENEATLLSSRPENRGRASLNITLVPT